MLLEMSWDVLFQDLPSGIRSIAEALDRRALDCSGGELIDFDSPAATEGFAAWRAYRARVVGGT